MSNEDLRDTVDAMYVEAAQALVDAELLEEAAIEEATAVLTAALIVEEAALEEGAEEVAEAKAIKAAAALEVAQVLWEAELIEEAAAEEVIETLIAAEFIKEEVAEEATEALAAARAIEDAAAQEVVETLIAAEIIEEEAAEEATEALVIAEIVEDTAAQEAADALIAAGIIEDAAVEDAVEALQESKKDEIEALYVQSARSFSFEAGALTLQGLAPNTLYFSDRPDRVVGHITSEEFLNAWEKGPDSFADDPPNATLSILSKDDITNVVVVLSDPVLEVDTMSYRIEILDGEMPASGGTSSLFIDVIGRPLTPVSIAGAHRRTRRRGRRGGGDGRSDGCANIPQT